MFGISFEDKIKDDETKEKERLEISGKRIEQIAKQIENLQTRRTSVRKPRQTKVESALFDISLEDKIRNDETRK